MQLATAGNATLDPILRSWLTVGLAQATRLFPIVALFALRSLGTSSPSWTSAAALHGLSLPTFVGRILGPWLAPAVVSAAMLVGLLATAEVGSVLLLHPPGMSSLPLAIFTIMANAPEALVGGLCLAYVGAAALLLGLGRTLLATYPRNS
jgi:ABC-type spermidine/putrescine transport system permease subunit II